VGSVLAPLASMSMEFQDHLRPFDVSGARR
jgi:hypothetical protein